MWEFETEPEFQEKLDWADRFVSTKVAPLDMLLQDPSNRRDERFKQLVRPLMGEVKEQGLWACHLGGHLGGAGYGHLKFVLLNEIVGKSRFGPTVFGCQAPDAYTSEILAQYGSEAQKARYLQPLLDGDTSSCISMTEPQAGADMSLFICGAVRDGADWVINGEKWFTSNARHADLCFVMAVTNPGADVTQRLSMFLVPRETPGIEVVRHSGLAGASLEEQSHSYIRYNDVRIPGGALLGEVGQGAFIAQTRLLGGRLHLAGRALAQMRRAVDMMCERAVSREVKAGRLSDLQITQERVADSWVELEQFRLLVLRTAWLLDKYQDYDKVHMEIAAVKVGLSKIYTDIIRRAMHLHGALGVSNEMPFGHMLIEAEVAAIGDPVEIHQVALGQLLMAKYAPGDPVFPSGHLPTRRAQAKEQFSADAVDSPE